MSSAVSPAPSSSSSSSSLVSNQHTRHETHDKPVLSVADLCREPDARLILADGTEWIGYSFGACKSISGEVVFNTGMVGYPEALTDPSYAGQILVLTYPLVGNYGVPDDRILDTLGLPLHFESSKIQVTGLIITDYSTEPSHYTLSKSLSAWLNEHNIPAIYGLDTRALTKFLRTRGAMLGKIVQACDSAANVPFIDPNHTNLVASVSRTSPNVYGDGPIRILAVDCGMKNNIIRYFVKRGVTLKVVPWNHDFTSEEYDGLFLSNGPGDPTMADVTIEHLRKALNADKPKPIFGICLGNQILALACGAKTYKMKFGNRGMNQPCIDNRTTLCYITPQNHGFAVDDATLPKDWQPFFTNANDHSNEGIIHSYKPFFSVQFHPEAKGGPTDTEFLFDMFLDLVKTGQNKICTAVYNPLHEKKVRKVLLLGSGGLSIGQAGEFDYSGSQAIKALKEENIHVVLINPNIATVQTSVGMADRVYFLPVTPAFIEQVIIKERPDSILLQFGGQTALNAGCKLEETGVLAKYGVKVLGTPVDTILATEDREIFARKLSEIGEVCAPSMTVYDVEAALTAADTLGYPVLARAGFALGGLGSGFANSRAELDPLVRKAFACSTQVIIDKSLKGWKEVEYEVVRDCKDNCITVCNMENFDPLGIHTGDSIVVAPSQTLTNHEFYLLRSVALKVVRHLGVVGECNIQYALDPNSDRYCIIEVNARLSRSSALASKATGYPLAYVAAKLALSMALTDVSNSITKTTCACFEPALDYLVVKIPRWDMRKFSRVSDLIGSAMKSVGEIMAIGRTFEEAFQKAIRMVDNSLDGFGDTEGIAYNLISEKELDHHLTNPNDQRVFALACALQRGYTVDRIYDLTKIDRWFLCKLQNIINIERVLKILKQPIDSIPRLVFVRAKRAGFSDLQLGRLLGEDQATVRRVRKQHGVVPYVKQIDTLAAEFPAQTNYLYMTYNGSEHDVAFDEHGVMVLGCGAYRIGSSCEFDWCAVSFIRALRNQNFRSIMVNYNPETVSTDYDECDRLYFEELSLERVLDIYEVEASSGVVVSVGGQIPNNLVMPLHKQGVRIIGTSAESIDMAENRQKFSQLVDSIGVDQPVWKELTSMREAQEFAKQVGYPVLVRPSYVLSGAAMNVASSDHDLVNYLTQAAHLNTDHPVVISKFIANAKEIEYDGVAKDGQIVNYAISEHVENAGVHSGDATLILPAQKIYVETMKRIKKISAKIAHALNITGPFNIQYLSKNQDIKVIECNLRASRSLPFVSKTFNVNFVDLSARVMLGAPYKVARIDLTDLDFACVKVPMFSFTRLQGADPILRVEMASTGEVACFGSRVPEAYIKGLLSTNIQMPKKNVFLSIGPLHAKVEFLRGAEILFRLGYHLFATNSTCRFLNDNGIKATRIFKLSEKQSPNAVDMLKARELDLVINVPKHSESDSSETTDGYIIRRTAIDSSVSLLSNVKQALLLCDGIELMHDKNFSFEIKGYDEYIREANLM